MDDFQLPSDGSILIIDDKIEEALPLIQLLSKKGFATTYFTGRDTSLPVIPIQKVRFAFVDIQLFGPSDAHSYAQNILRILEKTIPDNNGPYVLIIWSTTEILNSDELEKQVRSKTFSRNPVEVIRLKKSSYFETVSDNTVKENLSEEIEIALKTRLSVDDINAIKNVVDQKLFVPVVKRAKHNAVDLIYEELKSNLSSLAAFSLFTIWERMIHRASGETVKSYADLHKMNEYWQDNLEYSIYRMAHAQLGKTVETVSEHELIKNALKTLNNTFLDIVENEISNELKLPDIIQINREKISFVKKVDANEFKIKWTAGSGNYQLYINNVLVPAGFKGTGDIKKLASKGRTDIEKEQVKSLIEEYLSIKPEINNRLLIDFNTGKSIQPGNVYVKTSLKSDNKKRILKSYFKPNSIVINSEGDCILDDAELNKFIIIELEVTPICDYVQEKWLKSRLLPGLLVPEKYSEFIKDSEAAYNQIPLIKIRQDCYKPVFDFRLMKSIDIETNEKKLKKPIFRIRNEPFVDILSRLASHISRIGISYIE